MLALQMTRFYKYWGYAAVVLIVMETISKQLNISLPKPKYLSHAVVVPVRKTVI